MAQPKLSQSVQKRTEKKMAIDLSPTEEAARVAAGVPLDAALTESEVQNREAQKQPLMATQPKEATPEPAPTTVAIPTKETPASIIARFTAKQTEVTDARRAERRAEAAAFVGDLVTQAHSILTAHGILAKKYMAKVTEAHGLDWPALFASVPLGHEFEEKSQRMVPRNHDLLRRYQAITERAYSTLSTTFGSTDQGKDIDPVGLAIAAQMVERMLASGQTHYRDAAHGSDIWVDVINGNLKRGKSHLEWLVTRSRTILDQATEAVALFTKCEAEVAEMLARVTPGAVPPREEKVTLPALQDATKSAPRTSWTEFDPRQLDAAKPQEGPRVRPVGDHDGLHVGGR